VLRQTTNLVLWSRNPMASSELIPKWRVKSSGNFAAGNRWAAGSEDWLVLGAKYCARCGLRWRAWLVQQKLLDERKMPSGKGLFYWVL